MNQVFPTRHRAAAAWLRWVALCGAVLMGLPAAAITFSDSASKSQANWRSVQTAHSMGCEMYGQSSPMLYVGQCQDGLPHGRGLLIVPQQAIQGAKAERGEIYHRSPPEHLQGVQTYLGRAQYLQAFYATQWASDSFGHERMPGPTTSAVVPLVVEFLRRWGAQDPDQLAPRADAAAERARQRAQSITWDYLRAHATAYEIEKARQEWAAVSAPGLLAEAQALHRQRWRQEYDDAFARIGSARSAERFVDAYASNDPDRRVPKARELQARYAAADARAQQAQDAARAARAAREAANPVCMAQKRTCEAQCEGMRVHDARMSCLATCMGIRCD